MPITRNFTLYLNAGISVAPTVHVNQYDRGEQWVFTLLDDKGQKYTPSSGALIGVKADGNAIAGVTGTVGSNGDVYITETQQMTAAAGKAIFELTIDGMTHGTANFIVQVEKKPTDDAVLSESDLSIIQQGIDSVTPAAINETVSEYLAEHMTNPPIDPTLTVSNAAADAKVTGDKVTDVKSAINLQNDKYLPFDNILTWEIEIGSRVIVNGAEHWQSLSSRMSTKQNTYIHFKAGDVVFIKDSVSYRWLMATSTDGGSTWTQTSNTDLYRVIENDCIGFINVTKTSGNFSESDKDTFFDNVIYIIRAGNIFAEKNDTNKIIQILNAANVGLNISAFERGQKYAWNSSSATSIETTNMLGYTIPALKGDLFLIAASAIANVMPSAFTIVGLKIYEQDDGGTTTMTANIYDLSSVNEYIVQNAYTKKIAFVIKAVRETAPSAGYNEIFTYSIAVAKRSESELDSVLTESGDTWEV